MLRLRATDRSWRWLLVLFTLAGLAEGTVFSHLTAFVPMYLPELGVRLEDVPKATGQVVAISSAVGIPFVPLWGALADRYARQPIIVRSFIFDFLALIVMVLAGNLWVFIAGRAIVSFSMGNTGLMLTTLTERAPSKRLGLCFAIVEGAIPFGAFVGPLVAGPLVDAVGFRWLLGADIMLMVGAVLAMSLGYRDTFVATDRRSVFVMTADSFRMIGRSPRLRTLFLVFTGWLMLMPYAPIVIDTHYDGENLATVIGLVMGAAGVGTLALSPIIGMVGDRHGLWRVLFVVVAVEVVLLPLLAVMPDLKTFTLLWAITSGVASSSFALAFGVLSASAETRMRGRVMALSTFPLIIGLMVGGTVGSLVTQASVFTVFPVAALITASGVAALAYSRRQATFAAPLSD